MKRNRRGSTIWNMLIATGIITILLGTLPMAQTAYQAAQKTDLCVKMKEAAITLDLYAHYLSHSMDNIDVAEMIGSE